MAEGIDCGVKLTAANVSGVAAAGYTFCGRYLVPDSGSTAWKALTKAEAQRISDTGMGILSVWELGEDRAAKGSLAGQSDGFRAAKLARDLDIPEWGCIYFAVDYDAQPADFDKIEAYLKAAASAVRPWKCGVYGSYRVIEAMAARRACDCFWQCMAWSYGQKSTKRHVYQYAAQKSVAGVGVDINECADLTAAGIWDYREDVLRNMTKAELSALIDEKIEAALAGTKTTASSALRAELAEAKSAGITDGTRPGGYATREQVAAMVLRGIKSVK